MKGFVRIVEEGTLTAAASKLGVSLPSMVRTLAGLQRELGVTLLNRTTRRIHLTDDGRRYLEYCRLILANVEEAEGVLQARRTIPHGKFGVTASVAFGQTYVTPIVNEFLAIHPEMTVEFLLVNRIVNLVEEGFDAAIRIAHLDDLSLVSIPLAQVRRVVCAKSCVLAPPRRPPAPGGPSRPPVRPIYRPRSTRRMALPDELAPSWRSRFKRACLQRGCGRDR